jgi:hypothetical protein
VLQILLLDSFNGLGESSAPERSCVLFKPPLDRNPRRELRRGGIFYFFSRNPLKRLDSEKIMKGKEAILLSFPFISLLLFA